jgi:hypothetical protein
LSLENGPQLRRKGIRERSLLLEKPEASLHRDLVRKGHSWEKWGAPGKIMG